MQDFGLYDLAWALGSILVVSIIGILWTQRESIAPRVSGHWRESLEKARQQKAVRASSCTGMWICHSASARVMCSNENSYTLSIVFRPAAQRMHGMQAIIICQVRLNRRYQLI